MWDSSLYERMMEYKMKNERILLAVAAAALLATPAQADQHRGWYVGAGGGASFTESSDAKVPAGTLKPDYDTGYVVNGNLGYAWGNGLRTEAELGYRNSDLDKVTGPGTGAATGGSLGVLNTMFNALYDIDTGTFVTPYVGGGIGYASISPDKNTNAGFPGGGYDGDEGAFAYQAIGGLAFAVADNMDLTVDYRYLRALEETYTSYAAGSSVKTAYASHNVLAGLRYYFDEAPAAAAAPVAMAAPAPQAPRQAPVTKPVVEAAAQNYIIFFDFDQSKITPEAQRILASVASDYKAGKAPKVSLSGHADRSGKDKYNVGLSKRRAEAAEKELVRLGVPANVIATSWAGERENMVPTADGVREAQNRRVEIYLGDAKK